MGTGVSLFLNQIAEKVMSKAKPYEESFWSEEENKTEWFIKALEREPFLFEKYGVYYYIEEKSFFYII